MPLLLKEDYEMKLPKLQQVEQVFSRPVLEDIASAIKKEFLREDIKGTLLPGQKVAVAVGSRGIKNLPLIVKSVIEEIKAIGCNPFIVSAMGSHGAACSKGQREVLYGYGITEEAMGVEIITEMDTVCLGKTSGGIDVHFDATAYYADAIVVINRIKLHTDFVADIQSGICKMMVIGLGNHKGCSTIHEVEFSEFGETIKSAAQLVMKKTPIAFGVAILENAYDETCHIELLPRKTLLAREVELVKKARENMPLLMVPKIDVLIVEKIGKDISGAGFDPNILGRSCLLKEFVLPVPEIGRMVLLDVSEASHGNAIGLGLFDVVTEKVFKQLDYEAMYANAIAIKCVDDCKVPLVAKNEDEAIRVAIKTLRGVEINTIRVVKIISTLELEKIWVSETVLNDIKNNPNITI